MTDLPKCLMPASSRIEKKTCPVEIHHYYYYTHTHKTRKPKEMWVGYAKDTWKGKLIICDCSPEQILNQITSRAHWNKLLFN